MRERLGAKGHVGADHAAHLDHIVAAFEEWQVQINPSVTGFLDRIFRRSDATRHRGKFRMRREEFLDRVEVVFARNNVVVHKHQDRARSRGDRAILDSAFAGSWFMEMD